MACQHAHAHSLAARWCRLCWRLQALNTAAGGSRSQGPSVLARIKALCEAEAALTLHTQALQQAEAALKDGCTCCQAACTV